MARGAWRACALFAMAMGVTATLLTGAAAQGRGSRSLTQVERDRGAANAEAERLRGQAANTRTEIAALNARLVEAAQRRSAAEAAAADAEARLAALRLREAADGARYRQARDRYESAVIAAAFAQRRIDRASSRVGVFARAAAPQLSGQMRQSADALAEARRLDAAIAEEQSLLADAQQAIDSERADVMALLAQRRSLEASLRSDAAAAERRARQLAAEVRTLRELAARVTTTRRTASTTGRDVLPASWLAPAEGRVARGFGERTGEAPATQGVTLRTRAGAQVIAPASGEVAYAGLFRSYGQVLILNLDGGYALVLTGLGTVRARVGDTVLAGQPVGEMPFSDTSAPELYVEVRREGRPINPARWLSASESRSMARAG